MMVSIGRHDRNETDSSTGAGNESRTALHCIEYAVILSIH